MRQSSSTVRSRTDQLVRGGLSSTGVCLASAIGLSPAIAETAHDTADAPVEQVVVTGRKPTVTALAEKIQNTAQTINVIPQAVLHEQGVASLQEALKNVPGITLNAGEGGAHGDTVNLRGFPANDDFFLDGLRDTGYYTRDSFNLDAVEIYKGPASTLFGRGSTGGVINQVSKTPQLGQSLGGTLTGGTNDEVRGTVDANYGVGDDGAVRLNAMGQRSGVVDQPHVLNRRWAVAPSLALGIGGPTTFTASYLHQDENNVPDAGIPYVGSEPAKVARNVYYGLPSDDRTKATVDAATAKLTHQFNDALSIGETARYGDYEFVSRITEPHYGVIFPASGSPVCGGSNPQPAGTPLSQILVCRDRPGADGVVRTAMSNTQLTYKAVTGPLSHTLVAGVELDQETLDQVRFANQMSAIAPTPLLDPNPNEAFPGHQATITSRPAGQTDTVSGLIGDTIDIGPQWTVMAAVRYDRFHARYDEPIGNTHLKHTDTIATPRVSVVYKPVPTASVYFAYGTSYDPSAENLALSTKTADLAPEKDHTFEVGAKAAVLHERLSLTAAAFDTEMSNARVVDPVSKAQTLQGDLRVKGFELGASGYLTRNLEVIAGYTYLDARTASSLTPGQTGQLLPNTAHNQANLWTLYEFSEDFKIGTGINYLGQRAADAGGVAHIPGYVTWDGMISYQINSHVGLQLNGYNLTDEYYFTNAYYSSATENHVVPGAGRTVMLTATFKY
ncbi:MAG TPA: TonB-dependent siderophore receptor [Caulobacteraceae bacterium]|jgi:catecholate siderophore receptor